MFKNTKVKIGYQGVSGAYSEIAAEDFVKQKKLQSSEIIGCVNFEEIFSKVENQEFNFGIIPVENSLAGSIHKNFDLLGKHNLKVIGEVYVHVNHQLLILPNAKKENIKEVYSHYQALAQCEYNLKDFLPNAKVIEYYDTAASSEFVKSQRDISKAAISSSKAGKIHGLRVLKKDFQDDENNYTRFLVIAKNYANLKNETKKNFYKTSIIFSGNNLTGFLFKSLACFSLRDINLSKIESRPMPKSPWNYYFYLDFEGKFDDENIKNAIANLQQVANEVKILGSYKASKI